MRQKIYKVLIIGIIGLTTSLCYSQQDSQYTQYMYNTTTINPAYAGNRGVFETNILYRSQWAGIDGAPKTLTAVMNTPIHESRVGLGFTFYQDKIGPSTESTLATDFSYTIDLSAKVTLSFGIKGGINLLNVDFSKLRYNQGEPNDQNINNRLTPIIGPGIYFNGNDKWYIGLSAPNLLKTRHYDNQINSTANEKVHLYLIGGYVFELGDNLKFKPTILTKASPGTPWALDLSSNFLIYGKFTIGAAYRWDAAVSALTGIQISEDLMIGYAYDFDTTDFGNYNAGSHELFIRFELLHKSRKIISPRFF